jgi:hypothetical protein
MRSEHSAEAMQRRLEAIRSNPFAGVVEQFEGLSASGRSVARWSARVLAATLLLTSLEPPRQAAANIFDSLADQLRDAAIVSSTAPRWLPIAGLIASLLWLRGSLWSAVGVGYFHARSTPVHDFRRDLRALRPEITLLWTTRGFRWFRRALIALVWIPAVVSGLASTAFAAWVLTHVSSSLLVWPLIAGVSVAITNTEERLMTNRFAPVRKRPPNREEAERRLAGYLAQYPREAGSASPLLYAYSGLGRVEMSQRFAELSATGNLGLVTRVGTIVLIAAIFPHLPIPSIDSAAQDGFLGGVYANAFGFFRLAEANLAVSLGAALVLIIATPVLVLHAYHQFMAEWRMPIVVRVEALRRESRFAVRMTPAAVLMAFAMTAVVIPLLWLSAELANRLDSAVAGLAPLVAAGLMAIAAIRGVLRRNLARG